MKIGALQTAYLPWLGFFDQIARCDLFVIFDDLQYTKKDWRNRNKIKTPSGPMWLTVPIASSGAINKRICQVQISYQEEWQSRHWRALKFNYSRAPHFNQYSDFFRRLYQTKEKHLATLNRRIIDYCIDRLGITTEILYSADSQIEEDYRKSCQGLMDPNLRIVHLCERFGADRFLEGSSGKAYIDLELLRDAGVILEFHDYDHPKYRQQFGEFIPYLSIVDLLFNEGENSLSILTNQPSSRNLRSAYQG